MSPSHPRRSLRVFTASLCFLLATAASSIAEEASSPHRFVVRLSQDALQGLLADEINERLPVEEDISGVLVQGEAHVVGQPAVRLHDSPGQAKFDLILTGTAASRTVGQVGPATIYSRSQTQFEAVRPVVFEPGRGFVALNTRVAASTQCFTEGIGTARQGVVGRVIQRRAAKKIAERRPQTNEIARQRAELRIEQAVDRRLDARLARLNWLLGYSEEDDGRTSAGRWSLACSSTADHLKLSLGAASVTEPADSAAPATTAALAVCVHRSLLGPRLHDWIQPLADSGPADEFFIDLAMPGLQRDRPAAAMLLALFSRTGLLLREEAGWLVLELPAAAEPTAGDMAGGVMP